MRALAVDLHAFGAVTADKLDWRVRPLRRIFGASMIGIMFFLFVLTLCALVLGALAIHGESPVMLTIAVAAILLAFIPERSKPAPPPPPPPRRSISEALADLVGNGVAAKRLDVMSKRGSQPSDEYWIGYMEAELDALNERGTDWHRNKFLILYISFTAGGLALIHFIWNEGDIGPTGAAFALMIAIGGVAFWYGGKQKREREISVGGRTPERDRAAERSSSRSWRASMTTTVGMACQ